MILQFEKDLYLLLLGFHRLWLEVDVAVDLPELRYVLVGWLKFGFSCWIHLYCALPL